ncbi:hypothetical protein Pint_18709 [Pistacia integerrima]|uniref:Uncharacterized protein n=1 Tax=Pistacia integerrima TaxID=434235 RepID=A0ACC0Z169_9ROSI|nr:hypothetical protein Pint_18709 [Pistacia integerrima]
MRREVSPVRGRRTTGKERRWLQEMDDMATWFAARVVVVVLGWCLGGGRWISGACLLVQWGLKPNSYDFKVEVFSLEYDILNVNPDEYSYICFVKDMKRCVASENEVIEMNPYEKFKAEVELPFLGARYIVEGDDDMKFIFEQYKSFDKRVIRVYIEVTSMDFVEPITLLEAQLEDNEGFVRQDNEEAEEGIPDEFYWSVENDHEEDHESGHDGQGSMDGCHLKGPYGGVLLSVVSMDANNDIFPVAITICEIENKESWRYFMTLLKEFIGDIDPITIMSDRKKFLGLRLKNLFWAVTKAANIIDFQQAMEKVEAVDRETHRWMIKNDVRSWLRHAFDLDSKSDHVTNNMCEVFNSWLAENKELPILSLLEHYRRRVMVQMQARAKARNDWVTTVPPTVHRKINGLIEPARNVEAIWRGSDEFEVVDTNCLLGRRYILNLQSQTYDYGIWQLSGVPCVHAVRCLLFRNIRNMEDYVDSSLRVISYIKTYVDHIYPIPDPLSWPDLLRGRQLNPPIKHSKVGRPKKDADEEPRMTKGATLRRSFISPNKSRHVNIEATVKGSRYLRSVELKHVVMFWCDKTVEA